MIHPPIHPALPSSGPAARLLFRFVRVAALAAALVAAAAFAGGGVAAAGIDVTYLGNAGFLVAVGDSKVLVDGLYRDGVKGYATVPDDALGKIEQGKAPFDGIDLILATHYHADHFDPRSVAQHLVANPKATFVSTPQAVERLRAVMDDFDSIASRVRAVFPAEGESSSFDVGAIKLRVLNLHHGRGSDVENIGFVVSLGGETFAHFGDTQVDNEEMAPHRLFQEQIDLAFVGYWELQSGTRRRLYHDNVGATHIVAMHLPRPDASPSYFGDAATLEEAIAGIRRSMSNVVIFERPLETKHIAPPAD